MSLFAGGLKPVKKTGSLVGMKPVGKASSLSGMKPVKQTGNTQTFNLASSVTPLLHALEKNELTTYVPTVKGGANSGNTIAAGLDLGQFSEDDLRDNLKLSPNLIKRLSPYLGKKGAAAQELLNKIGPVTISEEESEEINSSVIKRAVVKLKKNFREAVGTNLEDEPHNVQQAILVASFNLGSSAIKESLFTTKSGKRTNFARQIKNKEYKKAGDNLSSWTKKATAGLKKRRRTEGDLLRGDIDSTKFIDQLSINLDRIKGGK